MNKFVVIERPDGATAEVAESAVDVWVARGWSLAQPAPEEPAVEVSTPLEVASPTPEVLPDVAESDVTAS